MHKKLRHDPALPNSHATKSTDRTKHHIPVLLLKSQVLQLINLVLVPTIRRRETILVRQEIVEQISQQCWHRGIDVLNAVLAVSCTVADGVDARSGVHFITAEGGWVGEDVALGVFQAGRRVGGVRFHAGAGDVDVCDEGGVVVQFYSCRSGEVEVLLCCHYTDVVADLHAHAFKHFLRFQVGFEVREAPSTAGNQNDLFGVFYSLLERPVCSVVEICCELSHRLDAGAASPTNDNTLRNRQPGVKSVQSANVVEMRAMQA